MEMNPLVSLLTMTEKSKWYPAIDLVLMVGYQLKLAGINYRTNEELADIMVIFHDMKVIEHSIQNNKIVTRFREDLYDAITV